MTSLQQQPTLLGCAQETRDQILFWTLLLGTAINKPLDPEAIKTELCAAPLVAKPTTNSVQILESNLITSSLVDATKPNSTYVSLLLTSKKIAADTKAVFKRHSDFREAEIDVLMIVSPSHFLQVNQRQIIHHRAIRRPIRLETLKFTIRLSDFIDFSEDLIDPSYTSVLNVTPNRVREVLLPFGNMFYQSVAKSLHVEKDLEAFQRHNLYIPGYKAYVLTAGKFAGNGLKAMEFDIKEWNSSLPAAQQYMKELSSWNANECNLQDHASPQTNHLSNFLSLLQPLILYPYLSRFRQYYQLPNTVIMNLAGQARKWDISGSEPIELSD